MPEAPAKKRRKVVVATSVPQKVADSLDQAAAATRKTTSGVIRLAIYAYLHNLGYDVGDGNSAADETGESEEIEGDEEVQA